MKIAIGSDHAGFDMKRELIEYLTQKEFEVDDCGCFSEESVDYPDIAEVAAHKVLNHEADFGILICGTGIGISISANKIKGIRCALIYNEETASLAKQHNNANMVAIGARMQTVEAAEKMIDAYLKAEFLKGRHALRVDKINRLDLR